MSETTMTTGKIGTLGAGSRFNYGGVEWVALEARPHMSLCLAADVLECRAFDEDNKNDFAASSLRAYLNGEFMQKLVEAGADKEAFATLVLDLTSDDGLDDYGTDEAKIGLITDEMYRAFRKIIPNASDWWWTATPFSTEGNGYGNFVRYVNTSGALSYINAYSGHMGVRPLCALKSEILVSYDEEKIKPRRETLGDMIGRIFADSLRAGIEAAEKEPEEEPKPAPDPEAAEETRKRENAVDMMKHIAAAFDIPATIDEEDGTPETVANDLYAHYAAMKTAGFTEAQAWEIFMSIIRKE